MRKFVTFFFFAVVVIVTLSFYYGFVKLSLALVAAVALLKTCTHIPFWNDHKISDNSVTSTNFAFDVLVCLIFLPLFCFVLFFLLLFFSYFSSFWYYSLRVLENGQETSLLRDGGHIVDHFSSGMRRRPAMYIWYICRIRHDVKGSRVSRTQSCKHLGLQSVM